MKPILGCSPAMGRVAGRAVGRFSLLAAWTLTACQPANSGHRETEASVVQVAPAQTPETKRMVERLALAAERTPPLADFFASARRAAFMGRQQLPDDPVAQVRARLARGHELLRAGASEGAAEELGGVVDDMARMAADFDPRVLRKAKRLLAVAHLRIGEQDNCVEGHTVDSCLLPIGPAGVHRIDRGSRGAMAILAELLEAEPDDLMSQWLYNLAAMTVGAYPDEVPSEWRIPSSVYASDHPLPRFFDHAQGTGLDTFSLAGGCVVEDLDGDGDLDVMVSSWGRGDPLRLFMAERLDGEHPTLRYVERTREAGLDGLTGGLNVVHADYDNDGDLDVLVLRGAWMQAQGRQPNSLLRNDGKGGFEDVTESAGLLSFHPTQTAAWGDYDNDGWLDLFIGNESTSRRDANPAQLYRNNGGQENPVTFTEVARTAGVQARGFIKGVAWGDADNDGWLDLYVSRIRGQNLYYRNLGPSDDGVVRFEEGATDAGIDQPVDSFATWFFDYDNDGWLDLLVADYATDFASARATGPVADYLGRETAGSRTKLYRNRSDGTFEDVSSAAGLDHQLLAMGASFGDLDNDGWLDVYFGTGAPDLSALIPNRMFRNAGGTTFQDVTTAGGFGHLQKGHGVAFADFDHDGDQDVFAVIGGAFSGDGYPNVLFANPGPVAGEVANRWITLRLVGTTSNRSAIGARIRLVVETPGGERAIYATVGTGGSFGSSSLQQEMGLGDATAIRFAEIAWPGGEVETFEDLALDAVMVIRQGDPAAEKIEVTPLRWPESSATNPHESHGEQR